MANIRPVATLTIDQPGVDGYVAASSHHFARNWEADYDARNPFASPWQHEGTEYIEALHAIAPNWYVPAADMDIDGWVVSDGAGYWRESRPAVQHPRSTFLHFVDSSVGALGGVVRGAQLPPRLFGRFLHYQPADGQTQMPYLIITMQCSGYGYGIAIPTGDISATFDDTTGDLTDPINQAVVWWSGADSSTASVISEREPSSLSGPPGSGSHVRDVRIEQLDDYLCIFMSDDESWVIPTGDYPLGYHIPAVGFYGHAGMFNLQKLQYPYSTTCRPAEYLHIPSWMTGGTGTATMYARGDAPAATSVSVSADYDAADDRNVRPEVSFVGNGERRPLLYRVQQFNSAGTLAVASDTEIINPTRMTWHRNNEWRRASFDAEFEDFDDIQDLPANAKCTMAISWDTGGVAPTPSDRIVGYLDGSHREYRGDEYQGQPVPTLRANDHPAARLNRKLVRRLCSFEGWTAGAIFEFIVHNCGVSSSLITVDSAVDSTYTVAESQAPWEPRFALNADTGVIQALDRIIVEHFGLQWGWDEDGYFLRERPEYSGTPDWTLDHDTTDYDEIVQSMTVARSEQDFANYVMALTRDGGERVAADTDSHRTATADNYIGDDWWASETGAESYDEAASIAQRRLTELAEFDLLIEFETEKLDLEPDNFVQVDWGADTADFPEIPDGTVFRVLEEDGRMNGSECVVTYTCGVDTYGT